VDRAAARQYLERAINLRGLREKITIDQSGANTAAIHRISAEACLELELHQSKYRNNIVAHYQRAVKRVTDHVKVMCAAWLFDLDKPLPTFCAPSPLLRYNPDFQCVIC
jgi:transposase-like protein